MDMASEDSDVPSEEDWYYNPNGGGDRGGEDSDVPSEEDWKLMDAEFDASWGAGVTPTDELFGVGLLVERRPSMEQPTAELFPQAPHPSPPKGLCVTGFPCFPGASNINQKLAEGVQKWVPEAPRT